jgi:hypothetical protein
LISGRLGAGPTFSDAFGDAPRYLHLVYHFGVNLVTHVFKDGQKT